MEFNEQGIWVYVQHGSDPYIQLMYDRGAKVNDGNWHLVTVWCNMVAGTVRHFLDTVDHGETSSPDLVMPAATYRYI